MVLRMLLVLLFCTAVYAQEEIELPLSTETQPAESPDVPIDDSSPAAPIIVAEGDGISLHASDVSLSSVLEILSLQTQRNIIATPGVRGSVTAQLYNVSFEEALDAVLVANQAGYRQRGNFIYVYTNQELEEMAAREAPPAELVTHVFRLNYISAEDAQAMVEPLLSSDGTVRSSTPAGEGISSSAEDAGGNSLSVHDMLVVRDMPDVIKQIENVLQQIDLRPQQVLIEATILRTQLTEDNALGVDFTLTGGVDLKLLGSESLGVTDLTVGNLPTDRLGNFNSRVQTDFTGAVPDGGVTFGVIKDHVALFIRALEGVADTTVIANPKVLALNKQRGEVIVGRQDGYPIIVTTETTSQQSSESLETGTRLIFRPYIGDDGYVRMELHPEDSRGEVVSGQPQKETAEITTNVILKDGQTILIGGLFRESTQDTRGQVPLFGDIPVLGTAFQSRRDTTEREEVIILLTVHVVKEDAYARSGQEQLDEIERIRIGQRRGIQWHGRERIAQYHYRKAVEHYAAGKDDLALWHVKLALHNSPRLVSALHLKEKLLNHRDWEDEGAMTRQLIHQLIAEDLGNGKYYGRPAPPFTRDTVDSGDGKPAGD